MNHSGSAFRKLAPYYAKRVEKSKDGVDLMDVPSFLRVCRYHMWRLFVATSCDNYAELTDTLTSTMHLKSLCLMCCLVCRDIDELCFGRRFCK